MALTLAIIDDHPIVREGIRAIVAGQEDLQLVAEAGDANEGYAKIEAARPELVLMDLALPGADGITAVRELLRRSPQLRLLMLSTRTDEHIVASALAAGALGYAGKDQPVAELLLAIRTVGQGHKYLPPGVSAERVSTRLRRGGEGPLSVLSTREREVFDLLVRGFGNEEIAGNLVISRRTVETHRGRILKKLHLHSAVDLIRLAALHNLLT